MPKKPAINLTQGEARKKPLHRQANLFVKRIYEDRSPEDGYRILIDRLWPRGIKKEQAHIDLWLKEIAPSHDLRSWFQHDPDKWSTFQERYVKELGAHQDQIMLLTKRMQAGPMTLLYAAKNETCNHAVALKAYLLNRPN